MSKPNGWKKGVLALLLLAQALAACSKSSGTNGAASSQAPQPFSVILASSPTGLDAPLFYGKAKGIFEKHGIELTLQTGKGSQVAYDTAASGRVDAAITVYSAIVLNASKGGGLISFGSILQVDPSGIVFGKSTGITSAASLAGRTLLVASGSATRQMLPLLLNHAGVPVDSVHLQDVQLSALYAAYTAGQGDGMVTVIPNSLPLVEAKRASTVLSFQDNGIVDPGYSLVAKPAALTRDKQRYTNFLTALSESEQAAAQDPNAAAEAVVAQAPELTTETVRHTIDLAAPFLCWKQSTSGSSALLQPEKLWMDAVSLFENAKMIQPGTVKPSSLFTNDIVNAAASSGKGQGISCK